MAGIQVDGANQKVVLDSDGDTYLEAATDDTVKVYVAGAQDFTITANTLTAESGSTIAAQALTATTVTASGILKTDDATEATSTTDGSLQTDGGLSVVKDTVLGDDLKLLSDSSVVAFGVDGDTTLTHTDGTGLTLNSTNKLCFNDASQFIQGSSGTVLSIGATDEIDLTATAVDLNGTLNVSGVATFQATPVFPDGSLALADLDIDGATDIGAAIVDADLFIVDDGAGGTNRKTTAARLKTYAGFSVGDITGATALVAQPATDDELVINDGGALKRLDFVHIQNRPVFVIKQDGVTTISDNSRTKVGLDASDIDTDSGLDTTNKRWVVPTARGGYYFVTYGLAWNSGVEFGVNVNLFKNGSAVQSVWGSNGPEAYDTFTGSFIIELAATDYLELFARQDSGSDKNATTSDNGLQTFMAGFRLS